MKAVRYYTRPSSVSFEGCEQATAVCYDKDGRTYDIHHWVSAETAQQHVEYLNTPGMGREAALALARSS